jgi:hypothetical protein
MCDKETIFESDALSKRRDCEITKFCENNNYSTQKDTGEGLTIKEFYEKMTPTPLDYHKVITSNIHVDEKNKLWVDRTNLLFRILLYVLEKKPEYENNYKIGIYGSSEPTSDIDVSVSFVGTGENKLHELIQDIEDAFVEILGVPCLSLDIEFYASIVMVKDCVNPKSEGYMDLSKISEAEFKQMRELAWKSILLNNRKRSKKLTENQIYNTFKKTFPKNMNTKIDDIPEIRDVFDVYTYDRKREKYYEKVKVACSLVSCRISDKEQSYVPLIIALANADIYREESYILLPTVLIIVHMKQKENGKTPGSQECQTSPNQFVECRMHRYGYILALMEQLGYMNRFYDNPKKYKKYLERAEYCLSKIKPKIGGKTRKKRRKAKRKTTKRR